VQGGGDTVLVQHQMGTHLLQSVSRKALGLSIRVEKGQHKRFVQWVFNAEHLHDDAASRSREGSQGTCMRTGGDTGKQGCEGEVTHCFAAGLSDCSTA
jgi:hypothetical protein